MPLNSPLVSSVLLTYISNKLFCNVAVSPPPEVEIYQKHLQRSSFLANLQNYSLNFAGNELLYRCFIKILTTISEQLHYNYLLAGCFWKQHQLGVLN